MAYLKTEMVNNGDFSYPLKYFNCDLTGIELSEQGGWFGNDSIHLSEEGVYELIEQVLERTKNGFFKPMLLVYLEQRYLDKIKPYRYIPKKLKQIVLKEYKHTCNICGSKEKLEIDHIKPITKGGLNEICNLQVLCKSCNIKKSNKY